MRASGSDRVVVPRLSRICFGVRLIMPWRLPAWADFTLPVAVIETEYIRKIGTKANFVMRRALRHPKLKHYARMYYTMKSIWQLKQASTKGMTYKDYWQAGKSVEGIDEIEPAGEVVRRFARALEASAATAAE